MSKDPLQEWLDEQEQRMEEARRTLESVWLICDGKLKTITVNDDGSVNER